MRSTGTDFDVGDSHIADHDPLGRIWRRVSKAAALELKGPAELSSAWTGERPPPLLFLFLPEKSANGVDHRAGILSAGGLAS